MVEDVGTDFGTAALIATILMPIVSLIKKDTWSHQAKYLLGLFAALLAALAGAYADGKVRNFSEFVASFGVALATSQTLYNLYFKDTGMQHSLEETKVLP